MADSKTKPAKKTPASKKTADKSAPGGDADTQEKNVEIITSKYFNSWMAGQGISLAFTTYQASKLFMMGLDQAGELTVSERTVERCMGIASAGRSLYVASKWQIWRFENALNAGERADGHDAVYVPKASHVTGDIDCHEMAVDDDGRLVFVNTLFNCLSYLSRDYSFHPAWKPDFVSGYVPEDRCHLNGIALHEGRPAYVTAVSNSDSSDGWRDKRKDGGLVIDVRSGDIVCEGLSMPHSPRMHGRTLWVQDSGTGYLGRVDLKSGTFEPVVMCPGFLRGMTIVGNDFRDGILFVPEVLLAANAMKGGMFILKPLLAETGAPRVGKMVIGTVKGDIHDIGKNLVGMMMEGAGFEVVDLGINNPVENYLEAIEREQPDIVGMSALLTTTMPYMKVVIDTMKEKGIRDDLVVLVGGAPLNEEFGKAVGADAYCRDAAVAVETAKDFMKRKHNSRAAV